MSSTEKPTRPRTFRIRGIPLAVGLETFEKSLLKVITSGKDSDPVVITPGELVISLTRKTLDEQNHLSIQIATVTFNRSDPELFPECKPGRPYYWKPDTLSEDFKWPEDGLTVDCDFYGMTPLYSAVDPVVEYVPMHFLDGL